MPQRKGLTKKLLEKLHPDKSERILAVSFLPQRLHIFGGAFTIAAPPDFRLRSRTAESVTFTGHKSEIAMTVMRMPFSIPLHHVTRAELCKYLLPCFSRLSLTKFQRGYVGHSPSLRLLLQNRKSAERMELLLIQVRGNTLFFTALHSPRKQAAADMDAMLQTVCISPTPCKNYS